MDSNKSTSDHRQHASGGASTSPIHGKSTAQVSSSKGVKKHDDKVKFDYSKPKQNDQDRVPKERLNVDLLGVGSWCDDKN